MVARETPSLFTQPRSWFDSNLFKAAEIRIAHESYRPANALYGVNHIQRLHALDTTVSIFIMLAMGSAVVDQCLTGYLRAGIQRKTLAIKISAVRITLISVPYDSSIHMYDRHCF